MSLTTRPDTLRGVVVCEELDETERAVLAERMAALTLRDGEIFAREGDTRRTLLVLVSGQIDVLRTQNGKEETVYRMHNGECAGTRPFIDGSARKVTLRSHGQSDVMTLEPESFEALLDDHPRIVFKVMKSIYRVTYGNLMRMNLETAQMQDYFLRTGNRH